MNTNASVAPPWQNWKLNAQQGAAQTQAAQGANTVTNAIANAPDQVVLARAICKTLDDLDTASQTWDRVTTTLGKDFRNNITITFAQKLVAASGFRAQVEAMGVTILEQSKEGLLSLAHPAVPRDP